MKKAKLKITIKNNNVTKETNSYSLKELIKIIIIMLGILGVFYLITVLIAKPVDKNNSDNSVAEIDHTKITLNNLFSIEEYLGLDIYIKYKSNNNKNPPIQSIAYLNI